MKPSVARIPSKYAYKREGRDIDDGMDRYEESESTIARDVQRAWESGVAVDDFIVPLGDHISPIEPKGVPALQSPENTHRAACSAVPARRLPPEIRSIILKLHEILSTLSHPWTASEIQNYVQQLQLSVYGIYWLLLFTEKGLAEGPMDASSDAIWQDHPVVEHLNTLLSRRSKTGRHASEPEGPESPLTEEKQPPYALSTDLVTETVSSTKPEIERIAVSTRMLQNRGLTKARPKDRKNPRVNQRRKFQRGVRKVKSLGVKSFLPEDRDGFKGVSSIKPHVIRTTRLS